MATEITNELQSKILESLSLAYILIDRNKKPVLFNEKFNIYFAIDIDNKNYFFISDILERIEDVFKTGNDSAMFLNNFNTRTFKLNFSPIKSNEDETEYVLCTIIENNDKNNWQKEFNLLFEKVPCYISIVDRNFKVIRSNEKYRDTFGDHHSVFHTETSKKKAIENNVAPAAVTFNEGLEHVAYQVGQTKNGNKCHLIVNSAPLNQNLVMEIATDITELNQLQEQLHQAHDFYTELIEKLETAVIAVDDKGKVQIINEAARNVLNVKTNRKPNLNKIISLIPEDFFKEPDVNGVIINNKEIEIKSTNDVVVPYKVNAHEITNKKNSIGRVAFLQNISIIKKLEKEKNDAESQAISSTFKALEANTMQIIKNSSKDFDIFEQELLNSDKEKVMNAWKILKFKNHVTNEIIASFIQLSVGYIPDYSTLNLENLIENSLVDFKKWAEYENINLDYQLLGELTKMNTDIRMFQVLITTLFNNAIISARLNPENPEIKAKFENNGKYLAVEIHDNGPYAPVDSYDVSDLKQNKNIRYGMLTLNLLVNKCGGSVLSTASLYDGNKIKVMLPL